MKNRDFTQIFTDGDTKVGYIPELSYGSHIFQDLVEAGILYTAVFEKESTVAYDPALLKQLTDKTEELTTLAEDLGDVFRVYEPDEGALTLYYDMGSEHLIICKE